MSFGVPEAQLAGVSGCTQSKHQQRQEEEDWLSGSSLPTHRHWLLGELLAERQDGRRGSHASSSCCTGLGSVRLSGAGAEAVRIGEKGWKWGAGGGAVSIQVQRKASGTPRDAAAWMPLPGLTPAAALATRRVLQVWMHGPRLAHWLAAGSLGVPSFVPSL